MCLIWTVWFIYFMFMFYDLVLNICSQQTHVRQTWLLLGITHYWHMQINYSSLTSDVRGKMTVEFSYFSYKYCKIVCLLLWRFTNIFNLYNIIAMFNVSSCLHICYILNLLIHYSFFYIKANYHYLLKDNK